MARATGFFLAARHSSTLCREHGRVTFLSMTTKPATFLLLAVLGVSIAPAQKIRNVPLPPSQNPSNADLPVSGATWAGDTLYVSGWLDPDMKLHADTTSQTIGVLKDLQAFLASQKLTFRDVVMVRVYLGGDPAKDGKADFAGMTAAYKQFFGTREQPNKPARTTLQQILPAASRGALVEIDMVAVRPK